MRLNKLLFELWKLSKGLYNMYGRKAIACEVRYKTGAQDKRFLLLEQVDTEHDFSLFKKYNQSKQ